jgi:16S rRNA methyltransferase gidB
MEKLCALAEKINVKLDAHQLEQFQKYYELLVEWNKVMNLTAITEKEDVIIKHFADSLLLAKYLDMNRPLSVIDVGTGAGFPGIPLKIAFPELTVTLLDSLNKRVKFLNTVISELGLENVQAIHCRAEDAGKNALYRETFDVAVSRAVANLASLSEFCLPFVKTGGYFIPYKASGLEDEMHAGKKAIRILGGQVENIFRLTIPDTDIERCFVFVKKQSETPQEYPRKAGTASKKPLGRKMQS